MVWAANPLTRRRSTRSARRLVKSSVKSPLVGSHRPSSRATAASGSPSRPRRPPCELAACELRSRPPTSTRSIPLPPPAQSCGRSITRRAAHLVRLQDANGPAGRRIVPDAARSWRISNHGRTYTFTIRRGLEFSPPWNQPVTAETFRYSFERDIEVDSQLGSFLGVGLRGAAPFLANHATHISGIRAHGYTLSITWTSQKGLLDFLSLLALPYASAVPIGWTGPGPGGCRTQRGPLLHPLLHSRLTPCTHPKPALSRAPARTHLRIHIR